MLPDLRITSRTPTVTPPTVPAAGTVSLSSSTVRNTGNGATGAFPPLSPGAGANSGTRSMTIPSSTTPGSYWIGMMADRTSAVLELNEGNNTVSTAINATRALIEREARLGMKKRDIESSPLYPEGRLYRAGGAYVPPVLSRKVIEDQ